MNEGRIRCIHAPFTTCHDKRPVAVGRAAAQWNIWGGECGTVPVRQTVCKEVARSAPCLAPCAMLRSTCPSIPASSLTKAHLVVGRGVVVGDDGRDQRGQQVPAHERGRRERAATAVGGRRWALTTKFSATALLTAPCME